jgi:hypothetical protein
MVLHVLQATSFLTIKKLHYFVSKLDLLVHIQCGRSARVVRGCAMAQAVSRRPVTMESRVRTQVNPCGICGGQSGTGTCFPLSISFHRRSPYSSSGEWTICLLVAAVQRCQSHSIMINQPVWYKQVYSIKVLLIHIMMILMNWIVHYIWENV